MRVTSSKFFAHAVICIIFLATAIVFAWTSSEAQNQAQDHTSTSGPAWVTGQVQDPAGAEALRRSEAYFAKDPTPGDNRELVYPSPKHPIIAIGAQAPDFDLPGVDGKNHKLSDYASAKVLVVLFESNHCPVMQIYEERVRRINDAYRSKGVVLVGINSNNPDGYRISELRYSDLPDTLDGMRLRALYRKFDWPYLYDGETQQVALKYGAQSTPHVFIFDQGRKLRYEGTIDDNMQEPLVKTHYVTDALDALLADKPVAIEHSRAVGCTTKWITNGPAVQADWAKVAAIPVKVNMAAVDDMKKLRTNTTGKVLAINFWSTKCKECVAEFHDRQFTDYMYRNLRPFVYVTVSTDNPKDSAAVLKFLQVQKAVDSNLQFGTADKKSLQQAFGLTWDLKKPFFVMIGQDGQIIYQKAGNFDDVEMRRAALAHFPDDRGFPGQFAYWNLRPPVVAAAGGQ